MIATILGFVGGHLPAIALSLLGGGGGLAALVAKLGISGIREWFGKHRGFLVLLGVAAAAGFLWVQYARVAADRDRAVNWQHVVCASAGAESVDDCPARVRYLAKFERDTLTASNAALGDALADHSKKSADDLAAATEAARDARAAADDMEKANARIGPDNRVGGDYFAALNRAAGLRPTP